jgi:sec-independent protein translocase protein TatA
MIGYPEVILIFLLVLLLLGPDELQKLARSLGNSIKEFKKAEMEASGEKNNLKDRQKDIDENILKLAAEMGIDTKNKTIEQLVEELRIKIRKQADK